MKLPFIRPRAPGAADRKAMPEFKALSQIFAGGESAGDSAPRGYAGYFLGDCAKGFLVDVADEDFGAIRSKGASKLAADAGGPGCYQDALRHDSR